MHLKSVSHSVRMRVPNSPHSLRKVMATGKSSSSEGEDSDGTAALGGGSADSGINFRPPRPKRNKSRDDGGVANPAAFMNVDAADRRFASQTHSAHSLLLKQCFIAFYFDGIHHEILPIFGNVQVKACIHRYLRTKNLRMVFIVASNWITD